MFRIGNMPKSQVHKGPPRESSSGGDGPLLPDMISDLLEKATETVPFGQPFLPLSFLSDLE
jgi:hypothetical protein